ncbi:STAS domain-containing protein [Actinokineospora sp. NPDC004072]
MNKRSAAVRVDKTDTGAMATVSGELDMATEPAVLEELLAVLTLPGARVELDLAEVTFCGSSGVRLLTQLHADCKRKGKTVVITHCHPRVLRILELSGVVGLFSLVVTPEGPDIPSD